VGRVPEVGEWGVAEEVVEGVEMAGVPGVGGRIVGDMVGDGAGRRGQAFESGNPQLSDPQPLSHEIALVADALDRLRFTPPHASNVGVGALVEIEDDEVLGAEVTATGA
jgi:hypothetical protein